MRATSMVILTVDDSDIILDILEFTLTEAGFDVVRAADGIAAIEWLENNRADFVTTDINMPRMNGFGLIETLSYRHDLGHPPIIVVSSERDESSVQRAMAAGASGWFVKPFDPQQLVAKLVKYRPSDPELRSTGLRSAVEKRD
jgi:two-component system, chemotaxis family, chemotaxis protein CheY